MHRHIRNVYGQCFSAVAEEQTKWNIINGISLLNVPYILVHIKLKTKTREKENTDLKRLIQNIMKEQQQQPYRNEINK